MKAQFIKPYTDPVSGKVFQPGWVAEFAEPDGARLLADGYIKQVDPEARTMRSALIVDCVPTGETMTLEELQDQSVSEANEVFKVFKKK